MSVSLVFTTEASVTFATAGVSAAIATVPVPAMVRSVPESVATTENALPEGVDPVSRFSSKVTVSRFPSTAALEKVGGPVLLAVVLPLKVATSTPPAFSSGLLVGLV